MASFTELVSSIRKVFNSGKTRSYEWRYEQLTAMMKMIDENRERLTEALFKDLHKSKLESAVFEIDFSRNECVATMNNLYEWMKPEKVKKGLLNIMDSAYIQRQPYGVALIIGAWNYPVQLTLVPMVGALSAGNCVIVKPSELSGCTAVLLEELVPKYFDNDCVRVVNGGVPETTALLSERYDYIFYTGNSAVGKIVMQAAAKNLTPVTLELGGKSPVYVDDNCDLTIVARRMLWGKCVNAGQTCVAPDYVMCTKKVQDELVGKMKTVLGEFYPDDPSKSSDYGRIVNDRHVARVKKLLDGANVALGGDVNEKDKYIAPTVITDVKFTDTLMQEEIFGPVLPIIPVKDENEAINYINSGEKPLSMYLFGNDKTVIDKFLVMTSSGSVCVNDTIMQGGVPTLPFGGVGSSGMGAYHGKFTFDTFCHGRAVLERGLKMDGVNSIRYPPYTEKKLGIVQWLTAKSPKKGFFSYFNFWS